MDIGFEKGSKKEGDRLMWVTTREKENFSIFKLAELCNQLAINELIINGDKIKKYNRFLFKEGINSAIEHAEQGIDWSLPQNKDKVIIWAKSIFLKPERIEPELERLHKGMIKYWQQKESETDGI